MTDHRLRAVALDESGRHEVHRATLEVLEHTGVEVRHDKALALLRKAGARVDGTRVRIAERTRRLRESERTYRLEPDTARQLDEPVAKSR